MIIPMLCVTIFVILVVWFLLPRVARLMIDRKSGSAGMPRPISYAVFCLKKKNHQDQAMPAYDKRPNPTDMQRDDRDEHRARADARYRTRTPSDKRESSRKHKAAEQRRPAL